MVKYKKQFQDMVSEQQPLFQSFQDAYKAYLLDKEKNHTQFFDIREDVRRVIRRYENALCAKSESGKYAKFSTSLSDHFWEEVRIAFPYIDEVNSWQGK